MSFTTADLYDQHEGKVQVALPLFRDYGGRKVFGGRIATVRVFEDNSLVRTALSEQGQGKVLVIDGGESLRCALVGDLLAQLGKDHGWEGIIVSGCIRDSLVIAGIDIGVKALGTNPRKSVKKGAGDRDVPVTFAGITFNPGDYVYADTDGILVATDKIA
jgi:regulator of ribonuclease activity A